MFVLTLAGFIALVFYTVYTRWLVVDTEEATYDVQRAFISVTKFDIAIRLGADPGTQNQIRYWWFTPIIENSGNTPTKNLHYLSIASCASNPLGLGPRQILACDFTHRGEPDDPELSVSHAGPQFRMSNAPLGPHASIPLGGIGVTDDFIKAIQKGYAWYIYGVIRYNDVFPRSVSHVTKYCYQIRVDLSAGGDAVPAYALCNHWNCADDECKADSAAYEAEQRSAKLPPPSTNP